jgi:hypothetical protein
MPSEKPGDGITDYVANTYPPPNCAAGSAKSDHAVHGELTHQ